MTPSSRGGERRVDLQVGHPAVRSKRDLAMRDEEWPSLRMRDPLETWIFFYLFVFPEPPFGWCFDGRSESSLQAPWSKQVEQTGQRVKPFLVHWSI